LKTLKNDTDPVSSWAQQKSLLQVVHLKMQKTQIYVIYFVAFCSLSVVAAVSDLGILVLVLSAIVLTVALGLITCVLSHYRPVAGEGAADGGTAADPHDAARTPTTAPVSTLQPLSTTLRLHPADISTATRTPRGRSTYRKK
jgi:hypothetical protein